MGELFRGDTQSITAPSGAGNNWAYGHMVCGPDFDEEILRKSDVKESCDSHNPSYITPWVEVRSSLYHHSKNTHTRGYGIGLGTYLSTSSRRNAQSLSILVSVFPSEDDTVTSPYNGMLALSQPRSMRIV